MNQNWIIACFCRINFLFILVCIPFSIHAYKALDLFKDVDAWKAGKLSTLKNYELYKTENIPFHKWHPGDKIKGDVHRYNLFGKANSTQTLMDIKGNQYWQRKVANRAETYGTDLENSRNLLITISYDSVNEDVYDGKYGNDINSNGTVAILNNDGNRWMIIDTTGAEVLLPPNTGGMRCQGFVGNKYWVFTQRDNYIQYDSCDTGEIDTSIPYYKMFPPDSTDIHFLTGLNGCCFFKEDGTVYKQLCLPDSLMLDHFYVSPDAGNILYLYVNRNTGTRGIIYSSIEGKVMYNISNKDFDFSEYTSCRFTRDGSYIILEEPEYGGHIYFVSLINGELIGTIRPQKYAISSAHKGYLAVVLDKLDSKEESNLVVYDLYNDKTMFIKAIPAEVEIWELNVSPEGEGFDFVTVTGDIKEHHYYRLAR